jgi:hypothetical protein
MAINNENINQVRRFLAQIAERKASAGTPNFMKSQAFETQYQAMEALLKKAQQRNPPGTLKPHEEDQLFIFLSMVAMLDPTFEINANIHEFVKMNVKDGTITALACALARGDLNSVESILKKLAPGYTVEKESVDGATESSLMKGGLTPAQVEELKNNRGITDAHGNRYFAVSYNKSKKTFQYDLAVKTPLNRKALHVEKMNFVYSALCQFHLFSSDALNMIQKPFTRLGEVNTLIREAILLRKKFVENIPTQLAALSGENLTKDNIEFIVQFVHNTMQEMKNEAEVVGAEDMIPGIVKRLKPYGSILLNANTPMLEKMMLDLKYEQVLPTTYFFTALTTTIKEEREEREEKSMRCANDLIKLIDFLELNYFLNINKETGAISVLGVEEKSLDSLENGISDVVMILSLSKTLSKNEVDDLVESKRLELKDYDLKINYNDLVAIAGGKTPDKKNGEEIIKIQENIINKHEAITHACERLPETLQVPARDTNTGLLSTLKSKFKEKVANNADQIKDISYQRPKITINHTEKIINTWQSITNPPNTDHASSRATKPQ